MKYCSIVHDQMSRRVSSSLFLYAEYIDMSVGVCSVESVESVSEAGPRDGHNLAYRDRGLNMRGIFYLSFRRFCTSFKIF